MVRLFCVGVAFHVAVDGMQSTVSIGEIVVVCVMLQQQPTHVLAATNACLCEITQQPTCVCVMLQQQPKHVLAATNACLCEITQQPTYVCVMLQQQPTYVC